MFWITKKKLSMLFCFLWFFALYALDIDLFRLVQKNAFTNETLVFRTIIEGVPPTQIDLTVQTLPQNVSFVGSKKEKIIYNGLESSSVELHFVVSKSGDYKLSSVPIRIRYGYQYLGFEAISVTDNPKTLQPSLLYWVYEKDGEGDRGSARDRGLEKIARGQRVEVLVEAQYFASIQSFSWQANEKTIVFNEKLLQDLPYREMDFSTKPIELLRFDFIALEEGEQLLPHLLVQGKSWAGIDVQVSENEQSIYVSEAAPKEEERGTEDFALGTEDEDLGEGASSFATSGHFGLTDSEKEALITDLEKTLQQKKALCSLVSLFSLFLSIFFFILWFIYRVRKKKKTFLLPLALSIFICYFLISGITRQDWAVFEGNYFYAIPEENTKVLRVVEKPVAVRLLLETNDWAHIAYPILKTKSEVQHAWVKKTEIRK